MNDTDLSHLNFLAANHWGQPHLKEFLYHPSVSFCHAISAEAFANAFKSIKSRLERDEETIKFLELHLLTEALLQRDHLPEWVIPWLTEHIDVADYVRPVDWQTSLEGRWHASPVFVVHETAYVRYFILGLLSGPREIPLWPEWADALIDETAKETILSAVKACARENPFAPNQTAFCYPLTVPNQNLQFTNASLGLPISLGFMALLNHRKLPEYLAASGAVLEDGSIREVGQLSKKISQARRMGFRVFLYPADNRTPSRRDDLECIPVSGLPEAWMAVSLYSPGQAGKLMAMANMLNDPEGFSANCAVVPPEWLTWAHQNGRTRDALTRILKSPILFETYIERLETSLEKDEIARAEILSKLLDPAPVKELRKAAPLSVFKWFTLNLSMANHRGDVPASEMWEREADVMVRQASVSDAEAFAAYFNHRFIGLHHNRYRFNPELPSFLKGILSPLEAQYQFQRHLVETAVNKTLGALYGSIAQNYGFCGPGYLQETRRYVILSQRAFGDGRAPEWSGDWHRQFNYLTYACLDAREVSAAEKSLLAYLEIDDWQEFWPKLPELTQWRHAALARFLADTREREKAGMYAEWAVSNKGRIQQKTHPWQLWLHNMGCVIHALGDTGAAVPFFTDSLALCLSGILGPTVQVMALLPLSGLWRADALTGVDMDSVEENIRKMAYDLNPVHFSPFLNEPDFIKTLENVWARPEEMFPFTYR